MTFCDTMIRRTSFFSSLSLSGVALIAFSLSAPAAATPAIIELTQTPCQFLESEKGVDHGYTSAKMADCEAINAQTGAERLAAAKTIVLKPGEYIFRVTNKSVPYELGFWLRGDGVVAFAMLPSVSGGGLVLGKTQDYKINLKPGEYIYSCPLNPTPNYKLVVR
jgi:hypothetical protein